MRYAIEAKAGYIHAELKGRESSQDMREFLVAVKAACQKHDCPKILLSIRASHPMFKAEDYGLAGEMPGYVADLVKPACRIALVGDSADLHFAHEYVELVARQQQVNVKSFREAASAVGWLTSEGQQQRTRSAGSG
jgi:hypothetical protein